LRAGARQRRTDRDRRKIDVRKIAHRQLPVRDDPEDENADHDQGGHYRPLDEQRREIHRLLSRERISCDYNYSCNYNRYCNYNCYRLPQRRRGRGGNAEEISAGSCSQKDLFESRSGRRPIAMGAKFRHKKATERLSQTILFIAGNPRPSTDPSPSLCVLSASSLRPLCVLCVELLSLPLPVNRQPPPPA